MNHQTKNARARAVADLAAGEILATVEIAAPPERVFRSLVSDEIVDWWTGEGLGSFRTTEWTAELRVGGRWRAAGVVEGKAPFALEGEFLEIDPPRRLVQTYAPAGAPGKPTVLTTRSSRSRAERG